MGFYLYNIVTISNQPSLPPMITFPELCFEIGNQQIERRLNSFVCLSSLFAITTILLWLCIIVIFITLIPIIIIIMLYYVTSKNRPFVYILSLLFLFGEKARKFRDIIKHILVCRYL